MSDCAQCGQHFSCGMVDADAAAPCWCTTLPALPADQLGRDNPRCYCPACLRALLARTHGDTGIA